MEHVAKKAKLHEADTPSNDEELLGANKADCIRVLTKFITNPQDNIRVCLITGPIGTGKTFIVKRVCEALDYEVLQVDLDAPSQAEASEFICRALGGSGSLVPGKRRLLLVDDLTDSTVNMIDLILQYGNPQYRRAAKPKKKTKNKKKVKVEYTVPDRKTLPVIITSSSPVANKAVLASCRMQIAVKPASTAQLSAYLKRRNLALPNDEIEAARGDIRYLTHSLRDPVFARVDSDKRFTRFQIRDQLVMHKLSIAEKLDLFETTDTESMPSLVKERLPLLEKREARVLELFSLGDLMTKDITRNQHWDLLPYKATLCCIGPAVICKPI